MSIVKAIDKYINILKVPNEAINAKSVSRLQQERIKNLEQAKENPEIRLDVRSNHIYIKLTDKEWLDLESVEYCLRYSSVVLKYPEIWVKI